VVLNDPTPSHTTSYHYAVVELSYILSWVSNTAAMPAKLSHRRICDTPWAQLYQRTWTMPLAPPTASAKDAARDADTPIPLLAILGLVAGFALSGEEAVWPPKAAAVDYSTQLYSSTNEYGCRSRSTYVEVLFVQL
jgi:hypothetical protein